MDSGMHFIADFFPPGNALLKVGCILNLNMAYIFINGAVGHITQPGVQRAAWGFDTHAVGDAAHNKKEKLSP
jgi:hypothetical protein